jgi:hypothetical protein
MDRAMSREPISIDADADGFVHRRMVYIQQGRGVFTH